MSRPLTGARAVGSALALAGATGWLADLFLPWLLARGPADTLRTVGRAELLVRTPMPYERVLLEWPVAAWAVCIAAGAILLWRARPAVRVPRRAFLACLPWWMAAAAGFVVLLTGTRWLGFYIARLLDSGASPVHLHIVPWLHLGLGAAILFGALSGLRQATPLRVLPWEPRPCPSRLGLGSAWLYASGLLALPLLPFASVSAADGATFRYDELSVAVAGAALPDWAPVADGLAWVRGLAWAGLALALGGLAAAPWAPQARSPWLRRTAAGLPWLLLLPAAAGLAVAVRLAVDLLAIQAATPGPNFLPQLLFLGAAAQVAAEGWAWLASRRAP